MKKQYMYDLITILSYFTENDYKKDERFHNEKTTA